MSLTLHSIHSQRGASKPKKRVGRGLGSTGTYSGRGVKGQSARSGVSGLQKLGIRQVMLATPKARGFTSRHPAYQVVNVEDLSKQFAPSSKISPETLLKKGLISSKHAPVKILAQGAITIPVFVSGCAVSVSAKKKIEEAGGTLVA